MTDKTELLKTKVLKGGEITQLEALELYKEPLEKLAEAAGQIRSFFCGSKFDLCTIVNGKSGACSENCKFCAQAFCYNAKIDEYPLLAKEVIVADARSNYQKGISRYSIVTSGRQLSDEEIDQVVVAIKEIREKVGIFVCVSMGLLNEAQYKRLRVAGADRVHNNIETSRKNFPSICTSHTFDDKIEAIKAAQRAGLTVCSGGIMGLGESVEDRIDMALTIRKLGISSVPVNMLNPIKGTPLGENELLGAKEMQRIIAVYRFLLPRASIRMAGGRGLLKDKGESCFRAGANGAISGDMLTTAGTSIKEDTEIVKKIGYKVGDGND